MTAIAEPLADIEQRARKATADATGLRDRIASGDSVTAVELAEAESAERLTGLQLAAAQERDRIEREKEAKAQLERDRAAFQIEFNAAATTPQHVRDLNAAAIEAASDYLAAEAERADYLLDLEQRGRDLGFRITERQYSKSALPRFGGELLRAVQPQLPYHWITPQMIHNWTSTNTS